MKNRIFYRKTTLIFSITFLSFLFVSVFIPTKTIAVEPATTVTTDKKVDKKTEQKATDSSVKKAVDSTVPQTKSLPPVELTIESIQKRIDDVNKMSSISAESKKKIINFYNLALKSLERRQSAIQQTNKYSNFLKKGKSTTDSGSNTLVVRPAAIEQKARSMALSDIENKVAELQTQLGIEQTNLEVAKELQNKITNKPAELRQNIASYETELTKLQSQLDHPKKDASLTPREIRARRTSTRAKCAALIAELKAAEQASGLTNIKTNQINDKLARMARKVDQLGKLIKAWGAIKETRQSDIAFVELRQNKVYLNELNNKTYPNVNIEFLQKLAKRNIEIAQEIITVGRSENKAEKSLSILTARKKLLTEDFAITSRRIKMMGLTKKSGAILQAKRAVLLTSRAYPEIVEKRNENILNANLKSDDLLQESQSYLPYKDKIYQELDNLPESIPENKLNTLSTTAFVLLESNRKLLENSGKSYAEYVKTLNSQTTAQKDIDKISKEFRNYINQRLLWTSSSDVYSLNDITGSSKAVLWLLNGSNWKSLIKDFSHSITINPMIWLLILLSFIVAVILQFLLPKRINKINIYTSKPMQDSAGRTITVVALGILQAICIPLVIGLSTLYFSKMPNIHLFARAMCIGIFKTAGMSIIFCIIIYFCRKDGIGITNFKWSEKICSIIRRDLKLLLYISIPLVFLITTIQNGLLNQNFRGSLGRTLASIFLIIILLFILKILKKIKKSKIQTKLVQWIKKSYLRVRLIAIAIPLLLIILAIAGYYFTIYEFALHIFKSFYLLIVFLFLKEILHRVVYLSKIHLAYKKAEAEKTAERERKKLEKKNQGVESSDNLEIELLDTVIDEEKINTQTFQLINFILSIGIIIGIIIIWSDVFPSIQFLNNVIIWSSATTVLKDGHAVIQQISLLNLLQTFVIFICTVVLVKNLSAIIEIVIFRGKQAHPGSRHAFTLISKYIVTCIGFFIGLKFIGIGWAQFQYMAAAMTVGLSFGLKDIFANFVSGIIILLERPIRMGDIVSVGQASGTVTKIQIRSTTITQWDRHELIVPNMCFLSEKIVNWSLSNDIMRVVISVSISHNSNAKKAEKILLQIAKDCPLTLETPAPSVVFVDFDTNSYKFALRVFVIIDNMMTAQHKIRHDIIDQFKEAEIVIPHAEQSIHFSTEEQPLKVQVMDDIKK